MKYTDLHCDTLYELYKKNLSYNNDCLHLRADFENAFDAHRQVFAIWTEHALSPDAAWEQFFKIWEHTKKANIPSCVDTILAVEGGALLGEDLSRLDILYAHGVRILTLVWQDVCSLGGAHNTDVPLSDFGKEAVKRCFSLGIQPDISHASDPMFWQCAELCAEAGVPLLATHSNARSVYSHSRNLTDDMFSAICQSGGVVGISMAAVHLAPGGNATVFDVMRHIEHFCALGGEEHLCLGCDFDGISRWPEQIRHMYDLPLLAEHLARAGYSERQIEGIFYKNANRFLKTISV